MSDYPITPRTEVNRLKQKARTDRATIHAILDAGMVGQLAGVRDGLPFLIPIAYARDGERLLFHGSTGAQGLRSLAAGGACCFNVTHVDGLVLARSGFESSIHYRSVTAFGSCSQLEGDAKRLALDLITERLLPERAATLRPMNPKELAATLVLELPLTEVSCKVSDDWPTDFAEDLEWPVWAGVVPIERSFGTPLPAPDLRPEFAALPEYIQRWQP